MDNIISCGVSSIKMDQHGQNCLIKFFPEKRDSDDELKRTFFYTIVSITELRAYGGVPKHCELKPVKKLENSDLFQIEASYKPAIFEGVSYYGSSKGLFWSFKEKEITFDDLTAYVDKNFPTAKQEFRTLIAKHIITKEAKFRT